MKTDNIPANELGQHFVLSKQKNHEKLQQKVYFVYKTLPVLMYIYVLWYLKFFDNILLIGSQNTREIVKRKNNTVDI